MITCKVLNIYSVAMKDLPVAVLFFNTLFLQSPHLCGLNLTHVHLWPFKRSKDYSSMRLKQACFIFDLPPKLEPHQSVEGGVGVWLFSKMWTVCLVCTSMIINASHCQSYHTAWKPCHTSLAPVSAPAFVYMHKHTCTWQWCSFPHTEMTNIKNSQFSSRMHMWSCTINNSLPCVWHTWFTHGNRMGEGRMLFSPSRYFSLYMCERAKWDYCNPAWPERRGNPNAVYFIPLVSLSPL